MPDASTITWVLTSTARGELHRHRDAMSVASYEECRAAFRELICLYIESGEDCAHAQGSTVRPCGQTATGAKMFKVRFALPGRGKSGSLRLMVGIDCESRRVTILLARERIDGLDDDDMEEARDL